MKMFLSHPYIQIKVQKLNFSIIFVFRMKPFFGTMGHQRHRSSSMVLLMLMSLCLTIADVVCGENDFRFISYQGKFLVYISLCLA